MRLGRQDSEQQPPAYPGDEPLPVTTSDTPADAETHPAAPDQEVLQAPQLGAGVALPETVHAADDQGGYMSTRPLLMVGAFGADVQLLGELLADNGHDNPIATGQEEPILNDEIMRLVRLFQADNSIDPSAAQDGAPPLVARTHSGVVDAATWEALGAKQAFESRSGYYATKDLVR